MTLPCLWSEGGLGDFAGRVRFRRHFGRPGQIDWFERVWLTFAGVKDTAAVWLNGQLLGWRAKPGGSFEFEVTPLLQRRNELTVEVESAGDGGLWGEVALEVRCTAFLRGVRAWAQPAGADAVLHIAGELVGTAERPLELYALLDGSTVIYATLEPAANGRAFLLCSEPLSPDHSRGHQLHVDLVNGAVVWYTVEQPFYF
jgi:hypothetical protein